MIYLIEVENYFTLSLWTSYAQAFTKLENKVAPATLPDTPEIAFPALVAI